VEYRGADWPDPSGNIIDVGALPATIRRELATDFGIIPGNYPNDWQVSVSHETAKFLQHSLPAYKNATAQINDMVNKGFMVTGVPIKLQSLKEKKSLIKNFDECVVWYNKWVEYSGIGKPYTDGDLTQLIEQEEEKLTTPFKLCLPNQSNEII